MPLLVVPFTHPAFWLLPVLGAVLLTLVLVRAAGALSATGQRDVVAAEVPESERLLPVVVLNPSKFDDPEAAKALITQECRAYGWRPPVYLETTVEDSGRGQARQALELAADVVMTCGGDGTVRLVAQELAGTGVPLGILPAGTGNLLARNLGVPLNDVSGAVRVALNGNTRPVDLGWVRFDEGDEQPFLVMTGMGFDGEIMAGAHRELKQKMGAVAYVAAGARRLNGHRTRTRIAVDDTVGNRQVRSVIVGNCGKLQAGIELMPEAQIDDGRLDIMALSPRGVVGWGAVSLALLTKRHHGHTPVEHAQGQQIDVWSQKALSAQVDGDPVGEAIRLQARVDRHALRVRVGDSVEEDTPSSG